MSNKIGLGNKKDLNADLNLTPFIDLLSTCVCFLLITAVWIQIGTIEIKQSYGTSADPTTKDSYDLDLVFKSSNQVQLNLKKNGKRHKTKKIKQDSFENMLEELNTIIASDSFINRAKGMEVSATTITPRSTVNYESLVKTLDVLRRNSISNIGVLTAKGN